MLTSWKPIFISRFFPSGHVLTKKDHFDRIHVKMSRSVIFDEEKFTTNLISIVETTLKSSSSRSYMETKASFSISKSRNEKRLSRSIYEIEKTKENIRKIKQRANTNVMEAEKDLEEKLKEIQKKLDIEVSTF